MSSNIEKQKENISRDENPNEVNNSSVQRGSNPPRGFNPQRGSNPQGGSNMKMLTDKELKRYIKRVMEEMNIIPENSESSDLNKKKTQDFNKNLKTDEGFSLISAGSINKISDRAGDNVIIIGGTENEMYGSANSGIYSSMKSIIDVKSHGIIIGGSQNVITSSESSSIVSGNKNVCENVHDGNILYSDRCKINGIARSSIQHSKDSEVINSENSHILFCSKGNIKSANNSIIMSSENCEIEKNSNNVFILHGEGIVASSGLVTGKYNEISDKKEKIIFEIGNGKDENNRNTSLKVTENGTFIDKLYVKSTGFGEYFEVAGEDLASGTIVELTKNGKIKVSESIYTSIGVVTNSCAVVGGEETESSKIVCLKGSVLVRREQLTMIPKGWFVISEDEEDSSEFVKVVIT